MQFLVDVVLGPMDQRRMGLAIAVHDRHQDVFARLVVHLPQRRRGGKRHLRLLVVQQVAQRGGQVAVLGRPAASAAAVRTSRSGSCIASVIIFSASALRSIPNAASPWMSRLRMLGIRHRIAQHLPRLAIAFFGSGCGGQRCRRSLVLIAHHAAVCGGLLVGRSLLVGLVRLRRHSLSAPQPSG